VVVIIVSLRQTCGICARLMPLPTTSYNFCAKTHCVVAAAMLLQVFMEFWESSGDDASTAGNPNEGTAPVAPSVWQHVSCRLPHSATT